MAKPSARKRDLTTFRAAHDISVIIPNKIKKALEQMLRDDGKEAYAYEVSDSSGGTPFARLADVSSNALPTYRKMFAAHIVRVLQQGGSQRRARFVWFATVEAATKARGGPPHSMDELE